MTLKGQIIKSKLEDLSEIIESYDSEDVEKCRDDIFSSIPPEEQTIFNELQGKSFDDLCEWLATKIDPYLINDVTAEIEQRLED